MTDERRRDDQGAILIIAMAIITVVALVTGFLLTQAGGNLVATVQLREVARTAYTADAAANIAINNLRLGKEAPGAVVDNLRADWVFNDAVDGSGCFGRSGANPVNDLVMTNAFDALPQAEAPGNDTSARVVCTRVAGTGIFGTGSGVDVSNNGSGRALTTLKSGSNSIHVKPLGNGKEMWIRGSVAANGQINADNGPLRSNGTIWANGCAGSVSGVGGTNCSYGAVADPLAGRAPNLTDVPALQTDLDCSLTEGLYDDAEALDDLSGTCSQIHLAPGNYYFDFRNDEADFMEGDNVWDIDTRVVGGQLTGQPMPGACRSPIDFADADGVQLIFGGDSRIDLDMNARVELCGTSNATVPPIVVYGLRDGVGATPVDAAATASTVVPATSGPVWTNATPIALAAAGGQAAGWTNLTAGVPSTSNHTASLTLTGIAPAQPIPAGSVLTHAEVRTIGSSSGNQYSFRLKLAAGAETSADWTIPNGMGTLDVTEQLAKAVHDGDLATSVPTITVSVASRGGRPATVSLDKVELVLTYEAPALRKHQPSAPFLVSTPSFKGSFIAQGVTYVPAGDFDMTVTNDRDAESITAFSYGLVANSVDFKGLPQYPYDYPIVSIPEVGPGFGPNVTAVDLKVYVCPGSGSCAASASNLALTSRVKITDDPDLAVAVPGRRRIQILSWAEQY